MAAPPPGYTKKPPAGAAAPPAGYTKKAAAAPDPANDQSIWQQMFDVRNAETGESYLYGNTPNPTGFDDVTRIMADTGSRGYIDKISGGRAQTDAARERTPYPVELASDITAAVASSPYRMGSTLAGGAFGAAEGAARSYGNQEGWVPDVPEITKDAAYGALLGGGGAALPGVWNAAKTGLGKVGAVPKYITGAVDYLTGGIPWLTGTSVASKGASAIMPKVPADDVTRDLLAKAMVSQGPR
jgi:hypothetical protein